MIIIDDYLNDNILIEIKNDSIFKKSLPYQYWEGGYWDNEPKGNVKKLITKLFNTKLIDEICNSVTGEGKFYPNDYNGLEYWINVHNEESNSKSRGTDDILSLDYHTDKDETLLERNGECIGPSFGCVYYFDDMIDDVQGGVLKVYENVNTSIEGKYQIDELNNNEPMVITPKFNRMIFFNPGNCLHCVTPIESGIRSAMAINFWKQRPLDYE